MTELEDIKCPVCDKLAYLCKCPVIDRGSFAEYVEESLDR